MRVYCDTNVFIDFYQERKEKYAHLGEFAFICFSKGWNCMFELVVSDWVVRECVKQIKKEQIEEMMDYFKQRNKLIYVNTTAEDLKKAKKMSRNWWDALHIIVAMKNDCDAFVTRDQDLMIEFSSKIDILHPSRI